MNVFQVAENSKLADLNKAQIVSGLGVLVGSEQARMICMKDFSVEVREKVG